MDESMESERAGVMMELIQLIAQIGEETGPWELAAVVGMLKANDVKPEDMPSILKQLRPYIVTVHV